ncbi:MAG: hypothetical protein EAZ81_11930 [Verrucomicrobia bacterium]|nr:MAG: hypothetical protein EAZ81_11930 [Verrucomicrobiota bacterium]
MHYPLTFRFKMLALAPQVFVTDASGQSVLNVKQKLFKLREKIEVYQDDARRHPLCSIEANQILDWSARYFFRDLQGTEIGSVGRKGMRSLWSAHYEIFAAQSQTPRFKIQEENPWSKVADSLLSSIPILGLFSGYFFHPKYVVTDAASGKAVMRLTKQNAFWEGRFGVDQLAPLDSPTESVILLSLLMLILLEKQRG